MLQTSTTDSEFFLFAPEGELDNTPLGNLSPEDERFYDSIKDKLNHLSCNPPQQVINKILSYSRSQDNF
jgi:hypothetical protein